MGCLDWLCCWRRENLQEEEVICPPVSSPSASESDSVEQRGTMGKAISKVKTLFSSENVPDTDSLEPGALVSEQPYEPLASPRSPLIRGSGTLTPPDTPILPQAKRLKAEKLYVDFPFLYDDTTIDYILRSKLMIILKGLPGSGKSTIAENIKMLYENAVICSADHFFMVDGKYMFNPEKLKDAHGACQTKAREAAKRNKSVIVIDNTNIKNWESSCYLQMCKTYHYVALMVEPRTPWRFDVKELLKKNSHGLKEDIISRKVRHIIANS
ncbi:NEDD4-binding protein 2-like [Palaemon carinicauda]|uniref:NEDD4-binding protein 2-like n=1 Tax=Palaemon carinicauda TaxID=392227 RepID=UPI0035B5B940